MTVSGWEHGFGEKKEPSEAVLLMADLQNNPVKQINLHKVCTATIDE